MAVLAGHTASGRQLYQGQPGTVVGELCKAPNATAYVTAPSATAYITEIVIANTTANAATFRLFIGGTAVTNALYYDISVDGRDTKILSPLKHMIPAGSTLQGSQGTASALTITVSGVEVV